ncbi:MAG: hypothetical protein ACKV2V_26225 [Blastocatellia bacterium]
MSAPESTPENQPQLHPDLNLELFDPFEKLVRIEIPGQTCHVPEKNSLLRCFQYVSFESISYGGFCWNGTCRTCEIRYHTGDEVERRCLACCTRVVENMVITEVSPEIQFD